MYIHITGMSRQFDTWKVACCVKSYEVHSCDCSVISFSVHDVSSLMLNETCKQVCMCVHEGKMLYTGCSDITEFDTAVAAVMLGKLCVL